MKYAIRLLCLLCVLVVAIGGGFWVLGYLYNIPDMTYEEFREACAIGKAPEDYGGLSGDGKSVFVTKDSKHTLEYWNRILIPSSANYRFETLIRVDHSYNEVRNAYIEAAACLYGGWSRKYSYTVQMAFWYQDEYTQSISPDLVAPTEAYPPSVAQAEEPGYHVYVRLSGKDAALIWEKLKAEFGDIIQPWNQSAQWRLAVLGPNSEFAIGWEDEFDPLVTIDLKSRQYLINERLYAEGKGEAP